VRAERGVVIEFPAALDPDGPERAFGSIRYDQHDPGSLDIAVHFVGDDSSRRENHSRLFRSHWNYFWLYGRNERPRMVEVLGITGATASGTTTIRPRAAAVQVDISAEPRVTDAKYQYTVQLTPSGILTKFQSVEFRYTGEIIREVLQPGDAIVQTTIGQVLATEHYQTYDRVENENRVTAVVERAVLTGEVNVKAGEALSVLHERLQEVVDNICDILSLCYRVPVTYYEISYFELEPRTDHTVASPLLRRKVTPVKQNVAKDELVHYRDLVDGGLHALYDAYMSHPERDRLRRAIRFGAGSRDVVGLEQSYFLTYAALESVLDAAADAATRDTIPASPFRKLCSHLRETIAQFAVERGFADIIDDIKEKLPELQRRSTSRKMVRVQAQLGLKVDDLWPTVGFAAGFARATRSRNELVHAAKIQNARQVYSDGIRVSLLTERLILKLLKWPDDKIWVWHDQLLKWANQDDTK
jgi:hypothetical protein